MVGPLKTRLYIFRRLAVALVALVALLVGAASMKSSNATPSADAAFLPAGQGSQIATRPLVRTSGRSDQSRPLRDIPVKITRQVQPSDNENPILHHKDTGVPRPKGSVDGAVQGPLRPDVMPVPIQNFDGEYNEYGPIPPDTNGDVGRNHYIQIVNAGFTIYNKSGSKLYGPTNNNTLFTGFGGICETLNAGDPLALYDPMADRWVLSWFTGQSNPTHECFAVSSSHDPLGSWYRYDFITSPTQTAFEDYPHMGVWPDAYYMTTNEFNTSNGGGNYAFDRAKMLRGDPTAAMIYFATAEGGLLPSDFDGSILPPAGSPNYFFEWFDTSHLAEYKFHVDWSGPTATFTGPILIPVTPFNYPTCSNSRERCVPQPGTTAQLEVIGDRLMYRVAYRNFGGYESIVLNHTVNATGGDPGVAAPRWYELRDPNNAAGASVFQQGTFYPGDGIFRWMGSIAQDRNGDIAMGYSASNSTLFPSIRYAGRLPTDAAGTFGQGEATLIAGTGSEDFPAVPRWGDYSNISIDPADDCTFWYTQEYFSQTGLRDWRTRIGSFKFPGCTASGTPTPVATATGARPSPTRTPGPSPTLCAGGSTTTGSITNNDPTQTGRLGLGGPKSSCALPKSVSGLSDSLTRHYRSYTYTNSSSSLQCVTVDITQNCGDNAVQSVAYLGSFNPGSVQTNYLADGGASGHSFRYSFSLPAGQTAVIVVVEVSPNLGCATYTMSINPCGPPTPTRTATRTPPTSTRVAATATKTRVPPTNTRTATRTSTRTVTRIATSTRMATATAARTATRTSTRTATRTAIRTATRTSTRTATRTATRVRTSTSTATATICTLRFEDVPPTGPASTFYPYVRCLACKGIISGYQCGGAGEPCDPGHNPYFRPNNPVSRGQIAKIVAQSAGFTEPIPPTQQTFEDVVPLTPFHPYVERLATRGIIGGYTCGIAPNEPCIPPANRKYYRPDGHASRGQLAKIVSEAAGFHNIIPAVQQTFTDVPPENAFWVYIERLLLNRPGVMSGYMCGGPGEACDPRHRNYFRWGNPVTRGQASKIDVGTFFPGCTPAILDNK